MAIISKNSILFISIRKIFKDVAIFSIFLSLFIGCSDEKVDVYYKGVSAKDAIVLLRQSDNEQESGNILNRIAKDPQYGFDWPLFWNQIQESGLDSKLNKANQEKLFSLSSKSCSKDSFNAFAKLAINHPSFHSLVVGDAPNCNTELSDEVFGIFFDYFKPLVFSQQSIHQQYMINLLSRQYKNKTDHTQLLEETDQISITQWQNLFQDLLKQNFSERAMELLNIHANLYGTSALIEIAILPATESKDIFENFQKTFGLSRVLDLLSRLPKSFYLSKDRSEQQWSDVINSLTNSYAEKIFYGRKNFSSADEAYLNFELITKIIFHLETKVSSTILLANFDKITRHLEKNIPLHLREAFFNNHETNVWTLLLKYRFKKSISIREIKSAIELEPTNSVLYQLQKERLIITSLTEEKEIHKSMLKYCRLMERANIKKRLISIENFQAQMLETPGCLKIKNQSSGDVLTIQQDRVEQSLSSVFMTGGTSLVIRATSVDISMIDLTSQLKHPDLAEEPPLPEDHAIAFPMVFGFRIPNETESFSAGTYYVTYQFTWREAKNGRPATTQPLQGFPGGNLFIEITDSENSFQPKVVSLGGAGQKAAPRRKGGSESRTTINKANIQHSLANNPNNSELDSEARTLLARPRISSIEEILKNAKRNSETQEIMTFIDTKVWLNNLSENDLQKVKIICNENNISEQCSHRLSILAAEQLALEIATTKKHEPGSYVLSRLSLEEYIEPAGALGPINKDGNEGLSGKIEMVGFNDEN